MARLLALVFAIAVLPLQAVQGLPTYGCDSPQSKQFDFWVGDWDLTYTSQGKTATSHNHVTKILDGCAVQEDFTGAPGTPLVGRSISTFESASGRWKQTWIDNTASYLDFTGGFAEGRMVLSREAKLTSGSFLQRMVYEDIRADGLKWLWQRSDDQGRTWTTLWEIEYRRAK